MSLRSPFGRTAVFQAFGARRTTPLHEPLAADQASATAPPPLPPTTQGDSGAAATAAASAALAPAPAPAPASPPSNAPARAAPAAAAAAAAWDSHPSPSPAPEPGTSTGAAAAAPWVAPEATAPEPEAQPRRVPSDPLSKTLPETAQQRAVPSSRLARVWEFSSLGVGLGMGALGELGRRATGTADSGAGSSVFATAANTERVVATLCRVRGAALKLGQMVSIQDSTFLPPELMAVFDRVRESADFMPTEQMLGQLQSELGTEWRDQVAEFEEEPFAAASIGQVHRAVLRDGRRVAMKIQYPGVADSIDSDIDNLLTLLRVTGLVPEGLYVERVLDSARKELGWECDYVREAECTRRFGELVADVPMLHVPAVVDELSTSRVLTTELISGVSLEKVQEMDQHTRNQVAASIMQLTLRELFEFRFMQTDPNWSNFLYDSDAGVINLLDFGASIEYEKRFIDQYIEIIHAAAAGDEAKCLEHSVSAGFLSGSERGIMQKTHVRAVMALGLPFRSAGAFDFGEQDLIAEVKGLIPTMLKYREQPPPLETYSLHRKLSGAFLLCARLNANIECADMFFGVYDKYPRA